MRDLPAPGRDPRHYPTSQQRLGDFVMPPVLICPSCDRRRHHLYGCKVCNTTRCNACGTGTTCVRCK